MQKLMCLVLITNADVIHNFAEAAMFWRSGGTSWSDINEYGPAAYDEFVLTVGTAATK